MARPKKINDSFETTSEDEVTETLETVETPKVKKTNATLAKAVTFIAYERQDLEYPGERRDYAGFPFKGKSMHQPDPQDKSKTIPSWDFKNAILRDADFTGCDLSGYNFQGSDVRGANFSGANLTNADFRWAYIKGAIYDENTDFTLCDTRECEGGIESMINA